MTSSYEWGWTAAGVGWVNFDPHLWVYDKANARCSRKSRFLQMRLAHRSHMVGSKQYIAFPVGGGPIAEELIAVSL